MDRYFEFRWTVTLGIALIATGAWFAVARLNERIQNCEGAKVACVLVACFCSGAYWHHGCWNWFAANDLTTYTQEVSTPVCLQATILGEGRHSAQGAPQVFDARPSEQRTDYLIQPTGIRNGGRWEELSGRAKLVIHAEAKEFAFGDEVQIYGKLTPIRLPTSPGQFNFQDFYRSRGIGAVVHVYQDDSIEVVQAGSAPIAGFLSRLRRRLDRLIWQHVGQEQAGFASAILLGNREQLSHAKREQFVATGTAHLLAISGLHIGILASMFLLLYRLGLLRRSVALWSTILFVLVYAWLVEFRPPATRAALLLSLFCFGRLMGRTGIELNLLAIAGLIILVLNPGDLFMLGPQLSFLAVASLILFKQHIFPPLSDDPIDILVRGSRPWWVRMTSACTKRCKQAIAVSGLIWLLSLPLIAANYHMVTPISLVANPLVMVPIAFALFCGLAVCCCGFISSPMAEFFGAGTEKSLQLVETIVERAEAIDVGHWWTAGPLPGAIVVFYLIFAALFWVPVKKRLQWLVVVCLLWTSLCWLLPLQLSKSLDRHLTQSTFIDVGHGSAVWIRSPNGQNILFDAGSMSSSRFAADTISNVLWYGQVEHLDAVIISHADLDHFNALPELVERFSIGVVYISEPMSQSRHGVVEELVRQLYDAEVEVEKLARGSLAKFGNGQEMEVLLPPKVGTGGNDNSNSIVLCYRAGRRTVLLPGDLEGLGMQYLLQMPSVDCDLVTMPHHGSKNSRPEEFVRWCRPEHVVVSASLKKTDQAVVDSVGRQVDHIYSTGRVGTIQATITDRAVHIRHWFDGQWVELE